ncbi:hypothetical protein Tel_01010 [Candidatus Tenderia electrophaga]|jgi:hypothetical protein|uniref:UPF0260 protein Tel_01010 n=1 Tax=Candidatus Tenderia electrophaga TaxID=1748243 RepID=A0A0S2T9M6_9GAMM|nr:hypothetical protein Tel_01010 [Candidatus Tenderia electrophaga]
MAKPKTHFWQHKTLDQMSRREWESLCDGCGRCCLNKLEDDDSGAIFYTDVACKLLDSDSCRCRHYRQRVRHVPDCLVLDMDHPEYFKYLPDTCAYRRLYEGKSLPDWHPLLSGDPGSVHRAGISVRGRCISEEQIHPDALEDHIIEFQT